MSDDRTELTVTKEAHAALEMLAKRRIVANALSQSAAYRDHYERAQLIIDVLAVHDFRVVHMPAGSPLWQHFAPVFCVGTPSEPGTAAGADL